MSFKSTQITAPARLSTDSFVLRPITADDAALDHAAVMESKDYLRVWEQTSWPEDDFTVEANREDLVGLEQRHRDDIAYTYTVLDPSETTCLGCVYVMHHNTTFLAKAEISPVGDDRWEDVDAAVYFWVRRSALAAETDRLLLESLRTWLTQTWGLRRHVFVTHEDFTQQVELIESSGLQPRFHIVEPEKPGRYVAYA